MNLRWLRYTLCAVALFAAMNFLVTADGRGGSNISTETRVYAGTKRAGRRFALYWRVIRPGSGFIRRMWLRAIRRRAEGGFHRALSSVHDE